jgi:tRNA dimethylallyltransferase
VGKTAIAIHLAKILGTEIISADARQFYREMSIGTAKPNQNELLEVQHHFINNLSIKDEYNAGKFEQEAIHKIAEIHTKNQFAIMVGGSGLFIKAVCDGFDEMPNIDPNIRIELNQEFEQNGLEFLLKELRQLDPDYFGLVDKNNTQRVIRALEVCKGTGKPFSSFRNAKKAQRNFQSIKIGLQLERKLLYNTIDNRVDKMLEMGLIEEAKNLIPFQHLNALQTVGYSELFDYFNGKIDLEEAIRLIKRNTRHYAKRQMTWFNKDLEIKWFTPNQLDEIKNYAIELQ